MTEKRQTNSKSDSEAPAKKPVKKAFSILKKCKCTSEGFHDIGEYYIDEQLDEEAADEDNKVIVLKPTEKQKDNA